MTRRVDVRATYDRIAAHFGATRPEPWPEVRSFLEGRTGRLGLDLGSGNGRHAELLVERTDRVLAGDLSRATLAVAGERAAERGYTIDRLQLDAAGLPIADGAVDLAVYVATIHHLPRRELRVASLDELARVLAPGGAALVSAWSVSHESFDAEAGFDTTVDWTLPDGETVPRFYHIYDLGEFEVDIRESALSVTAVYESAGNCYAAVTGAGA
ncbi:MAG: class I SAM-dependent methyltransferase [Halobacteriales archaeon]|nr:class I SAM-dependent methyltransferase [Halobacteriales archaeon]